MLYFSGIEIDNQIDYEQSGLEALIAGKKHVPLADGKIII